MTGSGSESTGRALVGAALTLAAAITFTWLDVLVKVTAPYLNVWQIAAGRCLFGLAVMALFIKSRGRATRRRRGILIAAGAAGAAGFISLTVALRTLPLAPALVLLYTAPAFSALLSPLLAREKVRVRDWLWIGVAFAGTALVLSPGREGLALGLGHLMALLAGFSIALSMTLVRGLRDQKDALGPYYYYCLAGSVVGLIPLLAEPATALPASALAWAALLAVAVTAMAANLLVYKSVQYISAPKTGVIMMAEAAAGAAVGVVFFGEPLSPRLLGGAALILGGAAMLVLEPGRTSPG